MNAVDTRCAALQRYEILDTVPEAEFDDLAVLAAQVCRTELAAISFLDRDRQWFKSRLGLLVSETPLRDTFSLHVVGQPDLTRPFVVADARVDGRFSGSPAVQGEPKIRFYAGAALLTPEGVAIGALCVTDRQPREGLAPEEESALRVLAGQVMTRLELRCTVGDFDRALREKAAALARVRELEVLLPVCQCCHGERDDDRYWNSLEEYLDSSEHTRLPAGLCRECATRGKRVRELDPREVRSERTSPFRRRRLRPV